MGKLLTVVEAAEVLNTGERFVRRLIAERRIAFASLRWGEAIALRRVDIDTERCIVRVRAAYVERSTGPLMLGPPKSRAGRRTIRYPVAIADDIRQHLNIYTGPDPHDLVFTGAKGRPLRRGNFQKSAGWREAARLLGVGGLHFHDLRHTGNTLAAQTGASLADLMARMGHDSPRAAMIYQHDTDEASQAIADALTERVNRHRETVSHEDPGSRLGR
jgi:excisionase family DNA binding protein